MANVLRREPPGLVDPQHRPGALFLVMTVTSMSASSIAVSRYHTTADRAMADCGR